MSGLKWAEGFMIVCIIIRSMPDENKNDSAVRKMPIERGSSRINDFKQWVGRCLNNRSD